jgi:hypothetical protein
MNERRTWVLVIAAVLAVDAAAVFSAYAGQAASGGSGPMTVSEVYVSALLGEDVYVKGTVSEVLDEYESQKGSLFQQFVISGGPDEVKIFCSERYGKAEAEEGDVISFRGKFQKYGGEYEVYGFCSEIEIM